MIQACTISMAEDLSAQSHSYLFTLYQPLMGQAACTLYEVMAAMAGKSIVPQDLLDFCGLSKRQFTEARKLLEQYMLLVTFEDEQQITHAYYLYAPKTPAQFLKHDILGRLVINNISAGRYQRIRQLFNLDEKPDESMKNVSDTLKADELEREWTEKKELTRQRYIPSGSELKRYPFDWELFFRGMERSIPYRLRTKDNLSRIAYLANVYGMGEVDMRRSVIRGISSTRDNLDFDVVLEVLQNTTKIGKGKKGKKSKKKSRSGDMLVSMLETTEYQDSTNDYESPLAYYQSLLPDGSYILPSERTEILKLSEVYGFPDDVVKYLLNYCLDQCQQTFNSNYIKKVADSWSRAQINTLEKAKEHTETTTRKIRREAPMPDWYYQEDPGVVDPELLARLQALQKEM